MMERLGHMIGISVRVHMTILNIVYRLVSRYLRLSLFVGRGVGEGLIGNITSNGDYVLMV